MESQPTTTTTQSKTITVEVPADRVPEFYAFFARFLAGRGRRGPGGRSGRPHRGPGHHGPGHHHGPGGCRGGHREPDETPVSEV